VTHYEKKKIRNTRFFNIWLMT